MIKMMSRVVSVVCLVGILVACGGSDKKETMVCTNKQISSETTITYSGKKVLSQKR